MNAVFSNLDSLPTQNWGNGGVRILYSWIVSGVIVAMAAGAAAQDVMISEFLAANVDGLRDANGDPSDWIEVHNRSDEAVHLTGWFLTDDPANDEKWAFPARGLEAGGRVIVFASGKDRAPVAGELHTNFQLDASGEYLALIRSDGTVASRFAPFPEQYADVSYGSGVLTIQNIELGLGSACRWLIPTAATPGWNALEFDDAGWSPAQGGVGYDTSFGENSYHELIGTDGNILSEMRGINATCYLRFPFEVSDTSQIERIVLGMKYDDGFVAYLNGLEVARDLAPNVPSYSTESINARFEEDVFEWNDFDLGEFRELLISGTNVLAIQGLNFGDQSSDFVILPRIVLEKADPDTPEVRGYFTELTPGQPNAEPWDGIVGDTRFSSRRGFYEAPIVLTIRSRTEDAQIWLTRDGSDPSPENGELYTAPIRISKTTVLRAAAFRERFAPSNIDTQTYLFASDVGAQDEMEPDVVNSRREELAQAMASLPVVSLALNRSAFFGQNGIYTNPELEGRGAEVPVSMEFFDAADRNQFQIDAGLRIHGGNAREHPKKPLRLYFRSEYGARRLQFPLFAGSSVDSFDQLVLRGFGHDGWALAESFGTRDEDIPRHSVFMRDQFLRKTENEMGLLSPQGRYVNVFINGEYWGFYDLHERPNAAFMQSHLGGQEGDYDVVHHPTFVDDTYSVVDGEGTAWDEVQRLASAGLVTTEAFDEIQAHVDIDGLCDHMIVRMWSGDYDWCGPIFLPDTESDVGAFENKNWYAGRQSRNVTGGGSEPFRFWVWDAEMSMGLHLLRNLGFNWVFAKQRELHFDLTRVVDFGSPGAVYDALRQNAEFRLRFADRVQKHFFNDGALSVPAATARLRSMAATIHPAVLAESARWGDEGGLQLTREDHWDAEVEWLEQEFIPERLAIVRDQFKAIGLYPKTAAPRLSHRGEVDAGQLLALTADEGGTIYYTLDGSDPLVPAMVDAVDIIGEGAAVSALVPSAANGGSDPDFEWREIADPANHERWILGTAGVGYDQQSGYDRFIELNLENEMADINSSAYLRFRFELSDDFSSGAISELVLQMRYDDGFVAYINGERVAGVNEPTVLAWNSFANRTNDDNRAIQFEPFDITSSIGLLAAGENVLAIHLLNGSSLSSDALLEPKLTAISETVPERLADNAIAYTEPVRIDSDVNLAARVRGNDGAWSALETSRIVVGRIPSSTSLAISQLHYRPLPAQGGAEMESEWSRSDFEFVEVMNVADGPVQMAGVTFDEGIRFVFPDLSLAPGERAVVVSNEAAFTARYGSAVVDSIRIAGRYSGQLNNGGELLRMVDVGGRSVVEFRFDDGAGWPASADGNGYALALADPYALPDPARGESWCRSLDIHGSPGAAFSLTLSQWQQFYFAGADPPLNGMSGLEEDPDHDGASNALEFALGTEPLLSAGEVGLIRTEFDLHDDEHGAKRARMQFRGRPHASGIAYSAESSSDLETWNSSATVGGDGPVLDRITELGDGSRRFCFRDVSPIAQSPNRYFRASFDVSGSTE